MRRLLPILLGVLLLAPGMAIAQEEDFNESGFYLGLGATFAVARLEAAPSALGRGGSPGVSGGVQAFGGYRFLSWLSAEAHFEYLPAAFTFNLYKATDLYEDDPRLTEDALDATFRPVTFTGNVQFIIPLGEIRPFASVGGGMMNGYFTNQPRSIFPESTVYAPTMRYVGGIIVGGARGGMSVTFDFSYVQPFGDLKGYDYFTIGLFKVAYHF
jgi:hypothetical protein